MKEPTPPPNARPRFPRPTKTEKECATLRAVFSEADFPEADVEHRECPDVQMRVGQQLWGVEITESHRSKSAGALFNNPDYAKSILEGAQPTRRDSRRLIPVQMQDGTRAIAQLVEPGERPAKLAAQINEKTDKNYDLSPFDQTFLIVLDGFDGPFDPNNDEDLASILTQDVREALLRAPFDEVYLVLRAEGFVEYVTVPCQQLLIWDYWCRWLWAFEQIQRLVLGPPYVAESFGAYLATISDRFTMADVDGEPAICYRMYALPMVKNFPTFALIDLGEDEHDVVERDPSPVFAPDALSKLADIAQQARVPLPPTFVTRAAHPLWESRGGHPESEAPRRPHKGDESPGSRP